MGFCKGGTCCPALSKRGSNLTAGVARGKGARDPNKREYQSAIRLFHYMVGISYSAYSLGEVSGLIKCCLTESFLQQTTAFSNDSYRKKLIIS